jgi:diaminobutyrate-2-oxoglutarate transaminase
MNDIKKSQEIFERRESVVRSYCRSFPTVFTKAVGSVMHTENGDQYIDFFAGAGALNYGHNPEALKKALVDYISSDGITHSLDMYSAAKRTFLETFEELILKPRDMDHRVQFPGPTGTNAVEAALKIARKAKGRDLVISFTNGFHGMTLGSLSVTGNRAKREGAGVSLAHTHSMPFDGYVDDVDSLSLLEHSLEDRSSGLELPAAFIVETVQAEGGVNVASVSWLRGLERLARRFDIALIVDDIQVGCGRTGSFFSFEQAGIEPDIICLSKSLSGYGLPFAITLIRPELDVWDPGEHNGTFRGHNPAFVTATEALRNYWADDALTKTVEKKAESVTARLRQIAGAYPGRITEVRGRGLIQGLVFEDPKAAARVSAAAFALGLIIETAGPEGEVVKLLPALTIPEAELNKGLELLEQAVRKTLGVPRQEELLVAAEH